MSFQSPKITYRLAVKVALSILSMATVHSDSVAESYLPELALAPETECLEAQQEDAVNPTQSFIDETPVSSAPLSHVNVYAPPVTTGYDSSVLLMDSSYDINLLENDTSSEEADLPVTAEPPNVAPGSYSSLETPESFTGMELSDNMTSDEPEPTATNEPSNVAPGSDSFSEPPESSTDMELSDNMASDEPELPATNNPSNVEQNEEEETLDAGGEEDLTIDVNLMSAERHCEPSADYDWSELLEPSEIQMLDEEGTFSSEVSYWDLETCIRSGHLEITHNERIISFMSDCTPLTEQIRYSQSDFEWRERYVNGRWRTVDYVQTHLSEQAIITQHEVTILATLADLHVATVNYSEASSSCQFQTIEDRHEETTLTEPIGECTNFLLQLASEVIDQGWTYSSSKQTTCDGQYFETETVTPPAILPLG